MQADAVGPNGHPELQKHGTAVERAAREILDLPSDGRFGSRNFWLLMCGATGLSFRLVHAEQSSDLPVGVAFGAAIEWNAIGPEPLTEQELAVAYLAFYVGATGEMPEWAAPKRRWFGRR